MTGPRSISIGVRGLLFGARRQEFPATMVTLRTSFGSLSGRLPLARPGAAIPLVLERPLALQVGFDRLPIIQLFR